jgi:hypothetical protein
VLVTRSGGITRCFHHGKTVLHNIVPLGNCRTGDVSGASEEYAARESHE